MIVSATVAFVAFNVGQAVAGSDVIIAMFGSDVIANAALTILQPDGISIIARCAEVASGAECVVQTVNTFTADTIARSGYRGVDVS